MISTRKCTNPAEDMTRQNEALAKAGCTIGPIRRSGNAYAFSADCRMQGTTGTSRSVMTVDSDVAYTVRVDSHFGPQDTKEVLRARRTGDC